MSRPGGRNRSYTFKLQVRSVEREKDV
ncbi:hypothetical protein Esi_0002_0094 [Ectocarpus siliculosus]|uniref:Uncharacterized protein n=1 Tax=Ectocarpus siliculosus TaxID=2880 RepID=D7FQ10_ECTSI|nr:hypothetical protein Esi_0002_0094 [Ectocarpus siliculosus]|eukprot:CBJ48342.1 hypothetical protein Esi_0002_0094 [Ectocarpus siliculosus]